MTDAVAFDWEMPVWPSPEEMLEKYGPFDPEKFFKESEKIGVFYYTSPLEGGVYGNRAPCGGPEEMIYCKLNIWCENDQQAMRKVEKWLLQNQVFGLWGSPSQVSDYMAKTGMEDKTHEVI